MGKKETKKDKQQSILDKLNADLVLLKSQGDTKRANLLKKLIDRVKRDMKK